MDAKLIARINELAALHKQRGLTDEEAEERQRLRTEYLSAFRASMKQTLDNTKVEYEDGTRKPIAEHNRGAQRRKE